MQQVLQLAHIAAQWMGVELVQQVLRQRWRAQTGLARDLAQQGLAQGRQVATAMAQRRHRDLDHVEAVVQVLAEAAGLDFGRQVLVRCADDAHLDRVLHR